MWCKLSLLKKKRLSYHLWKYFLLLENKIVPVMKIPDFLLFVGKFHLLNSIPQEGRLGRLYSYFFCLNEYIFEWQLFKCIFSQSLWCGSDVMPVLIILGWFFIHHSIWYYYNFMTLTGIHSCKWTDSPNHHIVLTEIMCKETL